MLHSLSTHLNHRDSDTASAMASSVPQKPTNINFKNVVASSDVQSFAAALDHLPIVLLIDGI